MISSKAQNNYKNCANYLTLLLADFLPQLQCELASLPFRQVPTYIDSYSRGLQPHQFAVRPCRFDLYLMQIESEATRFSCVYKFDQQTIFDQRDIFAISRMTCINQKSKTDCGQLQYRKNQDVPGPTQSENQRYCQRNRAEDRENLPQLVRRNRTVALQHPLPFYHDTPSKP